MITKSKNLIRLVISIGTPLLAGVVGSAFTAPAIEGWYSALTKPALNPPEWVFGPVWTLLYILMGISLYLIWSRGWDKKQVRTAIAVFAIQLGLNAAWSIIFFGLQSPAWALAEIAVLWIAIVATIVLFYKISRPAAYLLIPYIAWVSFAAYLNYTIWLLN